MGFVLKSIFWLGLVYSAMPFDESPSSVAKGSGEWLCKSALAAGTNAPEAYRQTLTAGCIAALAAPRATVSAAPPATPQSQGFALTDEDRRAPWQGPPPRPAKRKPKSG